MVPFAAVPENVNWPLNVEPLTLPLMSPDQRTELESQVPLTSDPDCVSTILTCAVSLFDEPIVPSQVPATLIAAVPDDTALGLVEFPLHAAAHTTRQTMSRIRMAPCSPGKFRDAPRGVAILSRDRRFGIASARPQWRIADSAARHFDQGQTCCHIA